MSIGNQDLLSSRSAVLLCLWVGMTWLVCLKPIGDADTLTQIKLGQIALEQGGLVRREPFSYLREGEAVANPGFLAQLIMGSLHQAGGWRLLKFVYAVVFSLAFVVAGHAALAGMKEKHETIGLFSAGCAVVLSFLGALSSAALRPQGFILPLFALVLYALAGGWACRRIVLVFIPAFLIWQNVHPSLSLAFFAALAFAGGAAAGVMRGARRLGSLGPPCVLAGLALVCQAGTPDGREIFRIGRYNLEIARYFLGVSEWLPPWDPNVRQAMVLFWILLILSVISLAAARPALSAGQFVVFALFSALSLYAARFALFWSLTAIPLLMLGVEGFKPGGLWRWRQGPGLKKGAVLCLVGAGMLGAALAPFGPRSALNQDDYPLAGIAALKAELYAGRVYNYREWGGPLTLLGPADWKIALDGRLYLYSRDTLLRYNRAAAGRTALEEIVARERPDAFFLHPGFHAALITQLAKSPDWLSIWSDENSAVFVRARNTRVKP